MALGLLKYHKPSTPAVRTPARCPVGRTRKQLPGCAEDLSIDPALPSPPLCTLGAHVSEPLVFRWLGADSSTSQAGHSPSGGSSELPKLM